MFRSGKRDPWAIYLIGAIADAFIYSDRIRYPLPLRTLPYSGSRESLIPKIVNTLASRDSELLSAIEYSTAVQHQINDDVAIEGLERFAEWIIPNAHTLKRWCAFHQESWIVELARSELARKYVYSIDALGTNIHVEKLVKTLGLPASAILYAFDSLLRFPLYGKPVIVSDIRPSPRRRRIWGRYAWKNSSSSFRRLRGSRG